MSNKNKQFRNRPKRAANQHKYLVWVEVEEVDRFGNHVQDCSGALNGAAIGSFDDLDAALQFAMLVQRRAVNEMIGQLVKGPDGLTRWVSDPV